MPYEKWNLLQYPELHYPRVCILYGRGAIIESLAITSYPVSIRIRLHTRTRT